MWCGISHKKMHSPDVSCCWLVYYLVCTTTSSAIDRAAWKKNRLSSAALTVTRTQDTVDFASRVDTEGLLSLFSISSTSVSVGLSYATMSEWPSEKLGWEVFYQKEENDYVFEEVFLFFPCFSGGSAAAVSAVPALVANQSGIENFKLWDFCWFVCLNRW